jgi:hypothetical protein
MRETYNRGEQYGMKTIWKEMDEKQIYTMLDYLA